MRIMTLALETALVLRNPFSAATHVRKAKVVREPRPIIRVPVVRTDRVDPSVIRYGNQEIYLPPWTWPEMWTSPLY
jgi:hypothetical protein